MKTLLIIMLCFACFGVVASGLDLRKFQSPILDAQASAKSVRPKFATFIASNDSKARMPGVNGDQKRIIQKKYSVKVMNEYRLYQPYKKKMSNDDVREKLLLERYCSRYNRHLLKLLGL